MRTVTGLLFAILLTACATVPKSTVTLSETIAQQTASLQAAHETLVSRYYADMRDRVDTFMRDVWIPTFLAKAVNNQAVQTDMTNGLAAANLNADAIVQKINSDSSLSPAERTAVANAINKANISGRSQLGQMMIDFSEEANRQIADKRRELIAPINEQEQLVLQKLRESYAQLQGEQATVRAFLASAVSVQQSQDEILKKLNLLNARDQAMNRALSLSDQASSILTKVDNGEKSAAQFIDQLKKVNDALRGGKDDSNGN